MVARGWFGVIMGLLWIGGTIWAQISTAPVVKETQNMQENGFYYVGEQQLTLEQYDEIKSYNDDGHGWTVVVTNPQPLEIKYEFLSLQNYDYLTKDKMPDKTFILEITLLFPIIGFAIGVLHLIHGFETIGEKEVTNKEEAK